MKEKLDFFKQEKPKEGFAKDNQVDSEGDGGDLMSREEKDKVHQKEIKGEEEARQKVEDAYLDKKKSGLNTENFLLSNGFYKEEARALLAGGEVDNLNLKKWVDALSNEIVKEKSALEKEISKIKEISSDYDFSSDEILAEASKDLDRKSEDFGKGDFTNLLKNQGCVASDDSLLEIKRAVKRARRIRGDLKLEENTSL
ncbi:MAG: hypothetical protein R6V40_02570 [Candidatus Moraniibacteriota bacterium]